MAPAAAPAPTASAPSASAEPAAAPEASTSQEDMKEAARSRKNGVAADKNQAKGSPSKPALKRSSSEKSSTSPARRRKRAEAESSLAAVETSATKEPALPPTFRQGDRIMVNKADRGMVQYVGEIKALGPGQWVGVQFDEPVGTGNPKEVKVGKRLFDCPPKHSGFFRPFDIIFEKTEAELEEEARIAAAPPPPPQRVQSEKLIQPGRAAKRDKSSKSLSTDAAMLAAANADASNAEAAALPPSQQIAPMLTKQSTSSKLDHHARSDSGDAEEAGESSASAVTDASKCVASGRGLHTAVVKQLAQFVITAYDSMGMRRTKGGDEFHVSVRQLLPPSNLRCKIHDHGNGTYTAEYKPEVSGHIRITITLGPQGHDVPIAGSPFTAAAVTLRPEPRNCVLRGEALRSAIARQPMSFEVRCTCCAPTAELPHLLLQRLIDLSLSRRLFLPPLRACTDRLCGRAWPRSVCRGA